METDFNCDILFINPIDFHYTAFPTGIATLAAILQQHNYRVSILNAASEKYEVRSVVKKVVDIQPKIVAFSGLIHTSLFNKKVSSALRHAIPSLIQIAGGWWAMPAPEFILRNSSVDYVVNGEADLVIVDLIDALIERKSITHISNLCYLADNGRFIRHPSGGLVSNFDDIPFPAYDLVPMENYILETKAEKWRWMSKRLPELRSKNISLLKVTSIQSGRGCYGLCDFCGAAGVARRNYSPRYVVDNMLVLMEKYGVNTFVFGESLTFSTRKWVGEFCEEILRRKMKIFYVALSRGDFRYDGALLDALVESGCVGISVGFESGSNDLLKVMHKNIKVEQYYKTYRDFTNKGILVHGQFITNMPGESLKTLDETIGFVKNTNMSFSFGAAHPYPGTKLFDYALEHSFCTLEDVMFTSENKKKVTKKELKKYLSKYNFNALDFNAFYKKWQTLGKIKVRNSLVHESNNPMTLAKILDSIPMFLSILRQVSRIAAEIRLAIDRFGRAIDIVKRKGIVTGGMDIMQKLKGTKG